MYNKTLLTWIFLFFFALISNCQEEVPKEKKIKLITEIDSILQSQVELNKIPGAVILIKKNTQVIYCKSQTI